MSIIRFSLCFVIWLTIQWRVCWSIDAAAGHSHDILAGLRRLSSNKAARKFLIVSQARSGTGWVASLLRSHSRVHCRGELLGQRTAHFQHGGCTVDPPSWSEAKLAVDRFFVGQLEAPREPKPLEAMGFKVLASQYLRHCGVQLRDYIRQKRIYVVRLLRRNGLRHAISHEAMKADLAEGLDDNKRKHPQNERELAEARQRLPTLRSAASLIDQLQFDDADADRLFASHTNSSLIRHIPTLTLYYEDIVADPHYQLRLLQLFLGLDPQPLQSTLLKLHEHATPIDELVANAEQVHSELRGTKHENFYCL
jgi:hypothetical protein